MSIYSLAPFERQQRQPTVGGTARWRPSLWPESQGGESGRRRRTHFPRGSVSYPVASLCDRDRETWRPELERGLLIDLSPQETLALIEIADAGIWVDTVSEREPDRLHMLGLVEQRGVSIGLTAIGIRTIARLKHR